MSRRIPGKELLAAEISRGRAFLGSPVDEGTTKRLQEADLISIIQEAQVIGAAVELRQRTEIAESVRASLATEKLKRFPGSSFPPS